MKNTQLLSADEGAVRFRYAPHRDEADGAAEPLVMRLDPEAFLTRYLAHIPVPRLQTARGYGLYGARAGPALDRARAALGQPPAEVPAALRVEDFLARFRLIPEASRCPRCGAPLRFASLIAHGPAPPTLH